MPSNRYTNRSRSIVQARRRRSRAYTRTIRRRPGRRRMGRKKRYPSRRNAFPTQNETMKQLKVYSNPFSSSTQQPKIPDGSRNFSLGTSFRSNLTVDGSHQYIMLFPGVQSFMGIKHNNIGGGLDVFPQEFDNLMHRPKTSMKMSFQTTTTPGTGGGQPTTTADKTQVKNPDKTMEAWRTVSCGLKIRCVSSDEFNEGHYQAIRLCHCHASRTKVLEKAVDGTDTPVGHYPDLNNIPPINQWPNDPSYSSGRIKDLVAKDFMLATEENDHPWTEWFANESVVGNEASYNYWYDQNFNIILLVLTGGEKTSILYDGFYNIEQTHRPGTQLNYYQTQTHQVSPKTLASVQSKKRFRCRKAAS